MAKLDLEWLSLFVALYKTQSVSRAAQRLNVAQSSASVMLNKLRRHFNDPLFVRTSIGMEPTPKAVMIFPDIESAVEGVERARGSQVDFVASLENREFRICMTDISEIILLPKLMNHLRQVAPDLSVSAEKISPATGRRLESGEVDIAVGFMPNLEAGFYQQSLFRQNFVCLSAKDHPRIGDKLDRRTFCEERHVVVTTSGTGHSIVEKVFSDVKLSRRIALRVPSFLGLARIVAQTELLAVVPQLAGETLALQEQIRLHQLPIRLPSYTVKVHWHERFHLDRGGVWLRQTIATLFTRLSDEKL